MKTTLLTRSAMAFALVGAMTSLSALADEAAAPSASVASESPSLISDKITAKYLTYVFGPGLAAPNGGEYQGSTLPDGDTGAASGSLFSKNYLSAGYKFNKDITLSPVIYFKLFAREGATMKDGSQSKFRLEDSYLKLSDANLINKGSFSLYGDVRLAAPTSEASQNRDMLAYVRSTQIAEYDIGRVALVFSAYELATAYTKALPVAQQDLEVYAGPEVDVTITPTLKATFLYELAAQHFKGRDMFSLDNEGTDFEPGFSWDITKRVNLSPFLNIYTGDHISMSTTSINAAFSVQFL